MESIRPRPVVAAIAISLMSEVPFPKTSQDTCALLSPQLASRVLKAPRLRGLRSATRFSRRVTMSP
jgi:hypothetical protein